VAVVAELGWFGCRDAMSDKIKMHDGDTMLIMVKGGEVIHFTPNMSLPHSEFVKRTTKELPAGAWVGTVSKLEGEVVAISSKHFFGYQLPAPPEVAEAVRRIFE
jgi:hypothetical protein